MDVWLQDAVVTGRAAVAVLAAHTALEVALRLVKPDNTVSPAIQCMHHNLRLFGHNRTSK